MSMMKLSQVEAEISLIEDKAILTPAGEQRLNALNAEADALVGALNETARKALEREHELEAIRDAELVDVREAEIEAFNSKCDNIFNLKKNNRWDEMFKTYGDEFIGDYDIDDSSVTSFATHTNGEPIVWETEDPEGKVKQLVNYRIYNKYERSRV